MTRPKQMSTVSAPSSGVEGRVVYNGIHVNQSTFLAGLAAKVHRWFRLTPSYGPDLVQEMLLTLKCGEGDVVLDPFAGAGTTMIECQIRGLKSIGFEINPFLHFVGNTSLEWDLDSLRLTNMLNEALSEYDSLRAAISFDNLDSFGLKAPAIHNATRWWRPDVLLSLIALRASIEKIMCTDAERKFFRLALAGVLVPQLTNVTLGRLQLHFINRSKDTIEVRNTFSKHAEVMISDIANLLENGKKRTSEIIHLNSTSLKNLRSDIKVDCVITSPPYPNRYSYVWNTRPHLYLFEFLDNATQAAELDKATIGGTWGTATSVLSKGTIPPKYPVVENVVKPVADQIRQVDNLMANYMMKYFNLLADQIVEMEKILSRRSRVAYVVGCSRLKGVYVETDVLLGKIFEGLGVGYRVTAIERIRKRHSGENLHESIVYAWKV